MSKINYIKFVRAVKKLLQIAKELNISYSDILISLNLKSSDISEDIFNKAQEYLNCNDIQREQLKQSVSPEIIGSIEKIILLNDIPKKIIELNPDNEKLIEILLGVRDLLEKASELAKQFEKIDETYLYIEYYNNRKKDKIDLEVENQTEFKPWNIFDLAWFDNNIITSLRKDKYSIEWIYKVSLEDLFFAYLNLTDRGLAQSAEYWFRDKYRDIESKVNAKDVPTHNKEDPYRERTDSEKNTYFKQLSDKYFIENKKE